METEGYSSMAEYRIQARRLLGQLRRTDSEEAADNAAARFRGLRSFSEKSLAEISRDAQLKHALTVIAVEHGYASWIELKDATKTARPPMYAGEMDVFLNRWFVSYAEARASLEAEGGFLIPYRNQFFVCEESAIRVLGLDPEDTDWERIGHDWVTPRDRQAWRRLADRREQGLLEQRAS
jgi:hypothetical protein